MEQTFYVDCFKKMLDNECGWEFNGKQGGGKMVLNIILAFAMYFAGAILYSYGIMQIILCARVSVPMITAFKRANAIDSSTAYKRTIGAVLIWSIISASVIFCVLRYGNVWMQAGFFVGMGFTLIQSRGKSSWSNNDNIIDFCKSNRGTIRDEAILSAIMRNDEQEIIHNSLLILVENYLDIDDIRKR